jgi:hypothetical protein
MWVLIGVVVIYSGVQAAEVYFPYWQLRDTMKAQAEFAPSITDDVIRRRILNRMDQLDLPDAAAGNLVIRRRQRQITISTTYQATLELPLVTRIVTLSPEVRQTL